MTETSKEFDQNTRDKLDHQNSGRRFEHPQIGSCIALLVKNSFGDKFEDELFWGLASSLKMKATSRLYVYGAIATAITIGSAFYAISSINNKLDDLLSLQSNNLTSTVTSEITKQQSVERKEASNFSNDTVKSDIESVKASIAKNLDLNEDQITVSLVPDLALYAVQIGTKGFLTDKSGTVAIPSQVVLPLAGQKEYFSDYRKSVNRAATAPIKLSIPPISDSPKSVVRAAIEPTKLSIPPISESLESVKPDDQKGLNPNILFEHLTGMTIDLPAKGTQVGEIMVFFDTKCPHCREQFNEILSYADKGYSIKFLNTPLKAGADKIFTTAFCSGSPLEALKDYMNTGSFSETHLEFDRANVGCIRETGDISLDIIKSMPVMPGTPYFAIKDVGFGTRKFVNAYVNSKN